MLTVPDLKALAAYLRENAASHTSRAKFLISDEYPTSAKIHEAQAEQLNHWAIGIEELVETRALAAVDVGAGPVIEGLTDGPIHVLRANAPGADAIVS